jgi:hypothetical protein
MNTGHDNYQNDLPPFSEDAYIRVLEEAREVSDRTLARLHMLCQHFPGGFTFGSFNLLKELEAHQADERRRALRRHCRPLPVDVRVAGADAMRSFLTDCSPYGLGVRLPRAVEVGTFLEVLPGNREGVPVLAEVRHCEQSPDGWAIGCEILSGELPI